MPPPLRWSGLFLEEMLQRLGKAVHYSLCALVAVEKNMILSCYSVSESGVWTREHSSQNGKNLWLLSSSDTPGTCQCVSIWYRQESYPSPPSRDPGAVVLHLWHTMTFVVRVKHFWSEVKAEEVCFSCCAMTLQSGLRICRKGFPCCCSCS